MELVQPSKVPQGGASSTASKKEHDPAYRKLRQLIIKLPMGDQIVLYRNHQEVQQVCDSIWRSTHKRLDFRQLDQELSGDSLSYFLNNMMDNFRYVYFTADRLQENLNVLERAGVKSLNNVQHCELLLSQEPTPKAKSKRQQRDTGAGDAGLGRVVGIAAVLGGSMMPQWPLHALPKMLRNLRRLKVHCEVQVHFIEQFPQLELLVLNGEVAQSALTGILERCKQLKRLFIKCKTAPPSLQGITGCHRLQDISLPMVLFMQAREQVLALPALHLLELTFAGQNPEMTIDCLRYVLDAKSTVIEIVQVNCASFDGPHWLRDAGLGRCSRLQGLVLNNCCFHDREITELNMPRVENYLVLSGCPDLKEYQLLDVIKKCPSLSELYLIDCPQLTGKVLHGIYRIRCSEKLDYPISIILSRCDTISKDYQDTYADYWYFKLPVLKLDRLLEENRPIEDMQLFFYKNVSPA
ncbi:uncharacterized protein LOC111596586 [Drosophila hydei]|uniref:Uncharacterized protein LOC111596586 n=1 Tax=Drosophila hydei TaxID=7224 RepID=A0A6J1LJF6_DROHY|nr:uncharacterized protein LOC111596586 [Drosophila hydei]